MYIPDQRNDCSKSRTCREYSVLAESPCSPTFPALPSWARGEGRLYSTKTCLPWACLPNPIALRLPHSCNLLISRYRSQAPSASSNGVERSDALTQAVDAWFIVCNCFADLANPISSIHEMKRASRPIHFKTSKPL